MGALPCSTCCLTIASGCPLLQQEQRCSKACVCDAPNAQQMLPRRPAVLCAHHLIFCSATLLPAALALKSASDSSSRLGSLSTESTTSSPGCFAGLSLGSQQGQAARQQLSVGQQGVANLSSLPGGWLQMADPEGAHRVICLPLHTCCCVLPGQDI